MPRIFKMTEEILQVYDWNQIQKEHNEGLPLKHILSKFNINRNRLDSAIELGLLLQVNHKQVMSPESRELISLARKEYLQKNPDLHPWRNGNRNKSVPCEKFKEKLKQHNIEFVEEYIPLIDRSFSMDIAIPNKMIGIEINGQQHYDNTGKLKQYYQERHDLIQSQGWTLYEIHYSLVWNDMLFTDIINKIKDSDYKIEFDFDQYNLDRVNISKSNHCPSCNKQITKYAASCRDCYSKSDKTRIERKPTCSRKPLIDKICPNCNNSFKVNYGNRHVKSCSVMCNADLHKKVFISKEQLHKLVWDKPLTLIGKEFNVSDNAIKKLANKYNLVRPSQTFWAKYHANKLEGFSCPLYP